MGWGGVNEREEIKGERGRERERNRRVERRRDRMDEGEK